MEGKRKRENQLQLSLHFPRKGEEKKKKKKGGRVTWGEKEGKEPVIPTLNLPIPFQAAVKRRKKKRAREKKKGREGGTCPNHFYHLRLVEKKK